MGASFTGIEDTDCGASTADGVTTVGAVDSVDAGFSDVACAFAADVSERCSAEMGAGGAAGRDDCLAVLPAMVVSWGRFFLNV